ncbi:hypothetical protein INT45_009628 [Circinella minor]|uniref:Uncharacterized protein n=1 Tax=Circinella minor TaxID=1195481 RepID=A0A8H7S749_9FUNG|nr:hypothetical protein INT45_009628 [Circinella minor]
MKFSPILFIAAVSSLLLNLVIAGGFEEPKPYQVLYVGYPTTVLYDGSKFTDNDTVAIFFDEYRSQLLAYGPAKKGEFTFIVPEGALTPESRKSSTLLAIFRRNLYLWGGDSVPVKVEMPPSNETLSENSNSNSAVETESSTIPIEPQENQQDTTVINEDTTTNTT